MLNTTPLQAVTWAQRLTPEQLAQLSLELGEVPNYARLAARKAAQQQTQWATFFRHPLAWLTEHFARTPDVAPVAAPTGQPHADRGPQPRMTSATPSKTSHAA